VVPDRPRLTAQPVPVRHINFNGNAALHSPFDRECVCAARTACYHHRKHARGVQSIKRRKERRPIVKIPATTNKNAGHPWEYQNRSGFAGGGSLTLKWLIDNYEAADDIFIFGFSRGAYTARSLAGFIAKCGLLKSGAPLGVKQLYNRYRRANERTIWALLDAQQNSTLRDMTLEEQWMIKYSMAIHIKLVGVWDTVGELGIPLFSIFGISRSTLGFLTTGLRRPIDFGFQALAVDDHRRAFSPTLWTVRRLNDTDPDAPPPRPLASVEQLWFVGAHAVAAYKPLAPHPRLAKNEPDSVC
jgi:hypothetical protein